MPKVIPRGRPTQGPRSPPPSPSGDTVPCRMAGHPTCHCCPILHGHDSYVRLRIPFSQLPRSSVQGGLMRSERKHGISTEQSPVSAYLGSSKNLKDLMDGRPSYTRLLSHSTQECDPRIRKVDIRLHGKGIKKSHGTRPANQVI